MDDEARKDVLGEALLSELQTIRELVEEIPAIKADVREIKELVQTHDDSLRLILPDHERRLTKLEEHTA